MEPLGLTQVLVSMGPLHTGTPNLFLAGKLVSTSQVTLCTVS